MRGEAGMHLGVAWGSTEGGGQGTWEGWERLSVSSPTDWPLLAMRTPCCAVTHKDFRHLLCARHNSANHGPCPPEVRSWAAGGAGGVREQERDNRIAE